MKRIPIYILMICLVVNYTACRKKDGDKDIDTNDTTVFKADFEWNSKEYIHMPILFKSNHDSEEVSLTWYFSDVEEQTVKGTTIKHTYHQKGTFNVTMATANGESPAVTKKITITHGLERVSGTHDWNHILYTVKNGYPGAIPNKTFGNTMTLSIPDDSTVIVPDIAQLPYRGPYTFKLTSISGENMVFAGKEEADEFSFTFNTNTAGLTIKQVRNDTFWRITSYANIYN